MVSFYTQYNKPSPQGTVFKKESLTKQSEAPATDINKIYARYKQTGTLPVIMDGQPVYGDFTTALSFEESMQRVCEFNEYFESLPAKVRDRFQNDPRRLLAFCEDEDNREEAEKLGLLKKTEKMPVESNQTVPATPVADSKDLPPDGGKDAA